MTDPFADHVLVEVVRNDLVESVHFGRVVITEPDGSISSAVGAVTAPIYPRSSLKPLQAIGMLREGLDLDGELLALVSASHSGEVFHQDGVRRILAMSGLDESVLQTPPDWPGDEVEKEAVLRAGGLRSSLAMNCSGKHAGMLRVTELHGWDVESYRDPQHPLQLSVRDTIDDLADEHTQHLAVDGCGVPLYALSLAGLARSFARIAVAATGNEHRLADAVRHHPEWASGTRRDEMALHRAIPGLLCKGGAEGVYAVGLPDGRGIALKISDGALRARIAAMAGVLNRLGFDCDTLTAQAALPVLGHGEPVGVVRPSAATMRLLG